MKKQLTSKQIIFPILLGSFLLTGCQNQSSEDIKMSNDYKEVCRYWIEAGEETYQKKVNVWKNKLSQCQDQLQESSLTLADSGGHTKIERYKNKTHGYTIEVPKSWGSIYFPIHPSDEFLDDLSDNMEAVGPLLSGRSDENWLEYVGIEIFTKQNTGRKEGQNWFDFYTSFRLENLKYITDEFSNKLLTKDKGYEIKEYVEFDKNEEYLRTHRLMSNERGLYVFSYDKDNSIHKNIIDSIELN